MGYENVARFAASQPWALMDEKLAEIEALLTLRLQGVKMTDEEREYWAAVGRSTMTGGAGGAVAVLPVFGVISQRMSMMTEMSGGTSTERLTQSFREVMADPQVAAIVLNVDSPGGSVYGIDELATEIRKARGTKPIIAQANSLMASAAYYIASAADEIVVTPSGEVGSIGVKAMHLDHSAQNEMLGVKATLVKAGKHKGEVDPNLPLSDDALAHLQEDVNRYYDMFVSAVAAGRGVSAEAVRNGFGEGRVVGAKDAVRLGMADRVATLDETLARLSTPQGRATVGRQRRAEDEAGIEVTADTRPIDSAPQMQESLNQAFADEQAGLISESALDDLGDEIDQRRRRARAATR